MSVEFSMPLFREGGAAAEPPARSGPDQGAFSEVLAAVGAEVDRGERLVQGVLSGRAGHLSAGELIALQAGIYRYSEVVDLSAKFIDRATSAVRTTLQSSG